jgi:hypothetical protein
MSGTVAHASCALGLHFKTPRNSTKPYVYYRFLIPKRKLNLEQIFLTKANWTHKTMVNGNLQDVVLSCLSWLFHFSHVVPLPTINTLHLLCPRHLALCFPSIQGKSCPHILRSLISLHAGFHYPSYNVATNNPSIVFL